MSLWKWDLSEAKFAAETEVQGYSSYPSDKWWWCGKMMGAEVFRNNSKHIPKLELINQILGMKMYFFWGGDIPLELKDKKIKVGISGYRGNMGLGFYRHMY